MKVYNMLIKGSDKSSRIETVLMCFSRIFLWKLSKNCVINTYTNQVDSAVKIFALYASVHCIHLLVLFSIYQFLLFFDAFQSKSQTSRPFAPNYITFHQLCLNQDFIVILEYKNNIYLLLFFLLTPIDAIQISWSRGQTSDWMLRSYKGTTYVMKSQLT